MKISFVFATVTLLSGMISGCDASSESAGTGIVGVWDCQLISEETQPNPSASDIKTFSADGQFSSSKFPEGKKYKYRLDGKKLITSYSYGDWTENVTRLTGDSLEYYNDKSGKPVKEVCKRKT